MKLLKISDNICRIAAAVLAIAALVLFFANFATIKTDVDSITLSGSQLVSHSKVTVNGSEVKMAISSDILFCMILTALSAVLGAISFKPGSKTRIAAPLVAIVPGIYMLVISLSIPEAFIDRRPISTDFKVVSTAYELPLFLATAALLLCAVIGIVGILLNDRVKVLSAKGEKVLSIPAKIRRFLREYKSEIRKISWPTLRTVLKNTGIVLLVCVILGAFIWLLDLGLGNLLKLILGIGG